MRIDKMRMTKSAFAIFIVGLFMLSSASIAVAEDLSISLISYSSDDGQAMIQIQNTGNTILTNPLIKISTLPDNEKTGILKPNTALVLLETLSPGTYTVIVETDEGVKTEKVLNLAASMSSISSQSSILSGTNSSTAGTVSNVENNINARKLEKLEQLNKIRQKSSSLGLKEQSDKREELLQIRRDKIIEFENKKAAASNLESAKAGAGEEVASGNIETASEKDSTTSYPELSTNVMILALVLVVLVIIGIVVYYINRK